MSAHAESEMSNKNPKNKHAVLRDLVAKQTLWPSAFEMSNDKKVKTWTHFSVLGSAPCSKCLTSLIPAEGY